MPAKLTQEDFIARCMRLHGNNYDYSETVYTSTGSPVLVGCPKHGIFSQTASSHVRGFGCAKCGNEAHAVKNLTPVDAFVEKANFLHKNKYDYSNVTYTNLHQKISIVCPIHGEFKQTGKEHLKGCGCKKCGTKNVALKLASTTEDFIVKARKIHGNKYEYNKVNYIGKANHVTITCPTHGDFDQRPNGHLDGNGCPSCGKITAGTSNPELEILKILQDQGLNVVQHHRIPRHDDPNRTYEIDLFLPDQNIGIEYHGLYWHSDAQLIRKFRERDGITSEQWKAVTDKHEQEVQNLVGDLPSYIQDEAKMAKVKSGIRALNAALNAKSKKWAEEANWYHYNKFASAKSAGIRLIQIYSDEWLNKRDIVETRLKSITGIDRKLYARKCTLRKLDSTEANTFLRTHHIQGAGMSSIRYGLDDPEGKLVAVMTFGAARFQTSETADTSNTFELIRYNCNCTVVGGFSKLLKAFIKDHNPDHIISYSDRRWSLGNVYAKNGFNLRNKDIFLDYQWVKGDTTRINRIQVQRHKLQG